MDVCARLGGMTLEEMLSRMRATEFALWVGKWQLDAGKKKR